MIIYKHNVSPNSSLNWYIAHGTIKGRRVFGAGTSHYQALLEALKA